jgi:hypothetical protein
MEKKEMSYSFGISAASKDEAKKLVEAELAKVVAGQPYHERDRQAAQDAAGRLVDALADPADGEIVYVSMSGSLSWRGVMGNENDPPVFTSGNLNVSASVRSKQ